MKHLFLLLFSLPLIIQAQTKTYQIKRAETKPSTDGIITAKEWAMHDLAEEFISYYPISGATMPKGFKQNGKPLMTINLSILRYLCMTLEPIVL